MDAEVQNAADQPPTQDEPTSSNDRQQGWRSWFRKNDPQAVADDASADIALTEVEERVTGPPRPSGQTRLPARSRRTRTPLVSRPLVNPRLRADPRLRVWISRLVLCLIVFIAVSIWKDWRFGISAAVIVAAADTILRSRTTSITPAAVRVTSARRATGRRLQVLKAAGYMALHARRIPGTESVIDHVVIGPSGVFIVDSQRMDTRLPVRAIGGMLFHGPNPQTEKIDHARYEAQQAAALIGAELGQRVRVRPTMVIYGPKLPWIIMRLKGVDVFDGGHVGLYFRKQTKATVGHHLDGAQVALVFAAAAHALPPLD
ncbi:MAG TPA: nuclease-related domain-containing protein [Streptosporangiaceae bacterium]|nr:nuclease-related domain-containing protein [Streptosporangiaceae bacterium]